MIINKLGLVIHSLNDHYLHYRQDLEWKLSSYHPNCFVSYSYSYIQNQIICYCAEITFVVILDPFRVLQFPQYRDD